MRYQSCGVRKVSFCAMTSPRTASKRWWVAVSLLCTSSLSFANPGDVDKRLQALEENWAKVQLELALMRQEIAAMNGVQKTPNTAQTSSNLTRRLDSVEGFVQSIKGELVTVQTSIEQQDAAITASSEAQSHALAISSYGNFIAAKRSGQNSLLDAESFEIVLSGQPHERIGFFSELEFERAAAVGSARGGEVLMEQAYVDLTLTNTLSLRAGVLLMPFGNISADHYAPVRDTISKSLSSYAIAPTDWADNGIGVVGNKSISDQWQLDYTAYVVSGLNDQIRPDGFREARQGFGVDNNNDKALVARVGLNRLDTIALGLAAYRGAYDDAGKQLLTGLAVDFSWVPAPFKLTGELMRMRASRDNLPSVSYWGGYLRTSYDISNVLPESWRSELFSDPHLTLLYQYDYVSLGNFDRISAQSGSAETSREWRHTLGFKFEPARSWSLKLNYEKSNFAGLPVLNGNDHAFLLGIGYIF